MLLGCANAPISLGATDSTAQSQDAEGLKILREKCSACHTSSFPMARDRPMMDFMSDPTKLAERRYVVAGKPELSVVYQRIADGDMPPGSPLSGPERAAVREYILSLGQAGPARKSISNAQVLGAVEDDLGSFPAEERRFKRYLSLVDVSNDASVTEPEYEAYRAAIPKLLNGLSWGEGIARFRTLSSSMPVYRIDTRFFESGAAFGEVERSYTFGFDAASPAAERIVEMTGSPVPILRGDWFIYHASQPPLYHTLLNFPATRQLLEARLGIDVDAAIRANRAVRVGFQSSGVSLHNRTMERHETEFGSYWISYDFANEIGNKTLARNPLGPRAAYLGAEDRVGERAFAHDGGEIIFNLPNGLQAYLLVDALGNRINQAPFEIVSDPNVPGRIVTNGISCNTCHNAGIIRAADTVRSNFPSIFNGGGYPTGYLADVLALYPPDSQVRPLVDEDSARHVSAMEATGNRRTDYDSINLSAQAFRLRIVNRPRGR